MRAAIDFIAGATVALFVIAGSVLGMSVSDE